MKSNILIGIFLLLLAPRVYSQWKIVTPDFGILWHQPTGLCAVSDEVAFTLNQTYLNGEYTSYLARTIDAGEHWDVTPFPDSIGVKYLYNLHFFNRDTGFVWFWEKSSSYQTILKTTDAGAHWTEYMIPKTLTLGNSLQVMHFFDENRGVLLFKGGVILTTKDGGQKWKQSIRDFPLGTVYHFNPDGSGTVCSKNSNKHLMTTQNFGVSWTIHETDEVDANWQQYRQRLWLSYYWVSDSVCYRVHVEPTAPYGPKKLNVLKTTDSGFSWSDDSDEWIETGLVYDMQNTEDALWLFTGDNILHRSKINADNAFPRDVGKLPGNAKNQMTILPNPAFANTCCRLKLDNQYSGEARVRISKAGGTTAAFTDLPFFEGNGEISLNDLPAGVYFITVFSARDEILANKKLIVF
ncbi:MAG: hypothetical protein KA165_12965 [Saprospiraceae bacterium]|nr:hypothetical protein [Saprospiraceae bacterium]